MVVQVNTTQMQTTAQQSANKAENMLTHAKTLRTGIDFVTQRWQGQAGDAFRIAMRDQTAILDQLIQKLQFVSETIKRGGEGFGSQDANARSKVAAAQGQNVLNAPLNR